MPKSASNPVLIADLLDRLALYQRSRQQGGVLNPAQWEALRYLGRANRYSRNPGALSRFLHTTKGTASQTVMALERKRLLGRNTNSIDRRGVVLELTPAGEALLREDPLTEIAEAAAALPPGTQRELGQALTALLANLQRQALNQSFGICRTCRFFRRNDAAAEVGGPHRCGLTNEALSESETTSICAEHRPAA